MSDADRLNELLAKAGLDQGPPPRDLAPFVLNADELMSKDIPPKEMLISTFMPAASFGMLVAPRGIGKSWFSLGLAVAVSTGQGMFLGWQVHRKTNVLFVDGEMQTVDLRDRLQALANDQKLDHLDILPSEELYQTGQPVCLDDKTEQAQIEAMLDTLAHAGRRPGLIILDNLSTLRRGVDENSNTETQNLVDFLVGLRHRGYAVLVVHHTNKAGKQRGASIIEVPMDYVIELKKPDTNAGFHKGAYFELSFSKVRGRMPESANFLAVLEEDQNGTLAFSIDQATFEVPDEIMVLRLYAEAPKAVSQRVIAKELGWSVGKTNRVVRQLTEKGGLEKKARGIWLTDQGQFELHEFFPDRFAPPEKPERFQLPF